jgi:hypothetical protein
VPHTAGVQGDDEESDGAPDPVLSSPAGLGEVDAEGEKRSGSCAACNSYAKIVMRRGWERWVSRDGG